MNTIAIQMLKKKRLIKKSDSANLFPKEYDYNNWYVDLDETEDDEKKESDDSTLKDEKAADDILPMSPLEENGFKTVTPKKLLTWFPVLLAQITAGNNSDNVKNENR